jgi:hypothetical protein
VSEDERALRARLAALEAEVEAETQAKRLAKARVDAERSEAARKAMLERAAPARSDPDRGGLEELGRDVDAQPRKKPRRPAGSDLDNVTDALALARRAADVKNELTRPRAAHEKSWMVSGGLSLVLGPIGWLYAGSLREAAPAALAYGLLAALVSQFIPLILLMPVLAVAMPLSAIAGVVYALTYNRHGSRQRLFQKEGDGAKPPRQLRGARRADADDE